MKISRRKLKSLIESVLNEVVNKPVSYKSADQERLEKELADLNEKALAAIPDDSTKRKVQDSIKKLMDMVYIFSKTGTSSKVNKIWEIV